MFGTAEPGGKHPVPGVNAVGGLVGRPYTAKVVQSGGLITHIKILNCYMQSGALKICMINFT